MDNIEPPKPKTNLGRKRGVKQTRVLSIATKAKNAAKRVIKTQNDKIKKAYKESPPPYALIPPGILAGEAARQQEQQQSLLDENIW